MTITDVIKQAIAEHRTVRLEYPKDGAVGLRTCDLHILFESSTGKIQVECWQTAGSARRATRCRSGDLSRSRTSPAVS